MNKPIILFLSFFLLPFTSNKTFGQAPAKDSVYHYSHNDQLIKYFNKSIGEQSRLYNGRQYQPYDRKIKGNAYFLDTIAPINGAVTYDGITYANAPILYDIYADDVLAQLYDKFTLFTLDNDKLQNFSLAGHYFFKIVADTLVKNNVIKTGFYDLLYNGKLALLAKRTKSIQSSGAVQIIIETDFVPKSYYYIKKDNRYYEVTSQSTLLDALKDHKKELQDYIKANRLKFGDNPERAMTTLCMYYDHLTD